MTARSISRSVAGPFARSIVGRVIPIETPAALFAQGQQGLWLEASPTYKGQQVLWQQSDGTVIVDANGDPVGRADDLSPNGNNATQPTSADRPLYGTDGSLHWLGFDGTGDSLGASFDLSSSQKATFSSAVEILTPRTNNAYVFMLGDINSATPSSPAIAIRSADGSVESVRALIYDGSNTVQTPRISLSMPYTSVLTMIVDTTTTPVVTLRRDGVVIGDSGSATTSTTTLGSSALTLGAEPDGTNSLFHNQHGIVIVDDALSGSALSDVEQYLAGRAGITL